MKIKTLSAVAVVTATLTVPAFAQYHHVRGPSYYGPAYGYAPAYGTTNFRAAYARLPVGEPFFFFYGDGLIDHSRVGGVDPDFRPSGN